MPSPDPLGPQRGRRPQATDRRAATSRRVLDFASNAFVTEHLRIGGGVSGLPQPVHPTGLFSERTAWVGRLTALGRFVRTETAGAALLSAAVLWADIGSAYQDVWEKAVVLTFGDAGIDLSVVTDMNVSPPWLVTGCGASRNLNASRRAPVKHPGSGPWVRSRIRRGPSRSHRGAARSPGRGGNGCRVC
jgi:hypothetical protein